MRRGLIIAAAIVGILLPARAQRGPNFPSPGSDRGPAFPNPSRRRYPILQTGTHRNLSTPIRRGRMQDGIAGPADEAGTDDGTGKSARKLTTTWQSPKTTATARSASTILRPRPTARLDTRRTAGDAAASHRPKPLRDRAERKPGKHRLCPVPNKVAPPGILLPHGRGHIRDKPLWRSPRHCTGNNL